MGRRKAKGRIVNGVLLLDKPVGVGSNEALQTVKRLFDARKAGHTGSLDRLASGLLPICFGEATKMSGFLLNADKRYLATFKLGKVTRTGDAEGAVLESNPVGSYSDEDIARVLDDFSGKISQIPPMHSAVKHQGKRLYKLAHQGLVVKREPREVTIHALELTGRSADELHVDIKCSKGTYIRTLAEDVGRSLGCGASVSMLHRIASGPFDASSMISLDVMKARAEDGLETLDQMLLPTDSALDDYPKVELTEDAAFYMGQGQPVLVPHAPTEGWVRIYRRANRFIGVGEVLDDGRIAPRRLLR
ncbi:MAG: tRNA pseudouridine(55) synthase TruB [Thiotrichales bacterium]|nr:tRNA pseudouridine(55) synthase TruB [Thiotrichales bacterium]